MCANPWGTSSNNGVKILLCRDGLRQSILIIQLSSGLRPGGILQEIASSIVVAMIYFQIGRLFYLFLQPKWLLGIVLSEIESLLKRGGWYGRLHIP